MIQCFILKILRDLKVKMRMLLRINYLKVKSFFKGCKWYWFDDEFYKNKNIFILGPAEVNNENLKYVTNVDLVIKINDYPFSNFKNQFCFLNRTDILYHNCYVCSQRNRGVIDQSILVRQGIKKVVYTYHEVSILHNFYYTLMKHRKLRFERTNRKIYKKLKNKYSANYPTTGLQALNHVLQSDFKKLYISGFTFFSTAYVDGYQDDFKSAFKARALAESLGNHNAKEELAIFTELYKKYSRYKDITLDNTMMEIMRNSL